MLRYINFIDFNTKNESFSFFFPNIAKLSADTVCTNRALGRGWKHQLLSYESYRCFGNSSFLTKILSNTFHNNAKMQEWNSGKQVKKWDVSCPAYHN
jgi:hypothetical protein